MAGLPSVERVITLFTRFPGIGRKSAQRLVHHLLKRGGGEIAALTLALQELGRNVKPCRVCHNLAEGEQCWVCGDPRRDRRLLCVVEEPGDLLAMEKAGLFRGVYHVLGGRLSPLDGVGPDELHLQDLAVRLQHDGVEELIVATNPTVEGEATAHYVAQLAKPLVRRITRLAYGLPMGGEMEYLDESTLYQALAGRREF